MIRILFFILICCPLLQGKEIRFPEREIFFENKKVKVAEFFLDPMEVSVGDFLEFARTMQVKTPHFEDSQSQTPVRYVDWFDARLYCISKGKRLPSYLEYVSASQGRLPRNYPFGQEFPGYKPAPFVTHSHKPTEVSSIGAFPEYATPEGIFHLAGNVAEWTSDLPKNQKKLSKPLDRLVYGGSYLDGVFGVQVGAFRVVKAVENTLSDVGFRCARSPLNTFNEGAGALALDPEGLKKVAYNQDGSDASTQAAKSRLDQLAAKVQRLDAQDREARVRQSSLELLREREELVSEESPAQTSTMVRIPFGYFYRGSETIEGSKPLAKVYLDSFEIDREPVRIEDYQDWEKKSSYKSFHSPENRHLRGDRLLAYVTWDDARAYCQANGKDLPSEAQWEKAVRGIVKDSSVRVRDGKTHGYYSVNSVGIGVAEWTLDGYFPYPQETEKDIRNPLREGGWFKVVRGQGTMREDIYSDLTFRRASLKIALHNFRCVRNLGEDGKPDFEISPKWNYFNPGFFQKLRKSVLAGENPFELNPDMGDFENQSKSGN